MTRVEQAERSVRRRTVLAAAVAMAALGLVSRAIADPGPVGLTVVDRETGRELPLWRHEGRMFVAGRPGSRYGLRVSNRTGGRVLAVLSVDGVNVLTGETARYDQRGYVLDPYESYDVTGWRKSEAEVAAFAFAALPRSYAARTGRPGDVGVIGMAAFKERVARPEPAEDAAVARWDGGRRDRAYSAPMDVPAPPPLPIPPTPRPSLAAPQALAEGSVVQRREEKLGTAHGRRETSNITLTSFERATSYPQSTRLIEYDTYANLAARGVVPASRPYAPRPPRPFPLEPEAGGFVPDPPPGR